MPPIAPFYPAQKPVIIVMVKAPRPGEVKTRLTPPLSPAQAADLARAFVQDVVKNAREACLDILIAYAPANGFPTLAPLLPFPLHWAEQQGTDLGERIEGAMASAEALGFGPMVVIGADSPTLPVSHLKTALLSLQSGEADLTLGPTEDGGYYLIGAQGRTAGLFDGVAWSTPSVFAQTLANGQRLGLRPCLLSAWYDVDTYDDLRRLRQDFKTDPALNDHAPATGAWLRASRPQTSA